MRFIQAITIFATTGSLVAPAIANPVPNRLKAGGGIAIPLTRNASLFLNSNKTMYLDAITSHSISVREKILDGLDNYQRNTGTMHPFAVKRSDSEESDLGKRGTSVPLTFFGLYSLWMTEIAIGTPPQTFKVLVDTGSADTWVLGAGCSGISRDGDFWHPKSSKSAQKYGNSACWYKSWCGNTGQSTFQLRYTGGDLVKGTLYTDNVTIGGFAANPQTFGSVTSFTATAAEASNNMNSEFPADGLLGLAYPDASKFGALPLFQSLEEQNRLINPTFSLKLSPSGGEIYVGGANSMLYKGDITYTRVTVQGLWQVSMDDVRVNGDKVIENVPALIDSGSLYIFGNWDQVAELYRHLGGRFMDLGEIRYYYLRCDSFPTLSLTFGGRTFEILPEHFRLEHIEEGSPYCFGAIMPESRSMPTRYWTIGGTFLQGVYSVFDYNARRVGFADLA